jgi:hypothetical protein
VQRRSWIAPVTLALGLWAAASGRVPGQNANTWRFAVSGDSRNCGDVVMPGIAAGAIAQQPSFHWHLGDFRKGSDFDEDMQHEPEHLAKPMSISEYDAIEWDDFIQNQIAPFGALPVYLSIGNHELVPPHTHDDYIEQFADWLDAPALRAQRLRDNPKDHRLKAYYHWIENGVDFITLDNGSSDQFDEAQVKWFEKVLRADESNAEVHAIVLGMHRALPDSISAGHSMNESAQGTESGRVVYKDLLEAQNKARKHVYVLASHSHFFMENIFNTEYWRANGGILPGWIVGTAGAVRYPLPENWKDAKAAETNVYGFLIGTVAPSGEIHFDFHRVEEKDIPAPVVTRFTPQFVHWCFAENSTAH